MGKEITKQLIDNFIKAQEKIDNILNSGVDVKAREICYILGHKGYDKIKYIDNSTVCCEVSYSGCDSEDFDFPTKLMFMNDTELQEYKIKQEILRRKREEENQLNYKKKKEQEEKELYLKLKEKYEKK